MSTSHLITARDQGTLALWTSQIAITLAIVLVYYPGFMTYDTIHALDAARGQVTDSMWPPMVSYVWRAVDLVSMNPAAMHWVQVQLVVSSVSWIIFRVTRRVWWSVLSTILVLAVPVVLGTISVIWKDVLMTGLILSAAAILLWWRGVTIRWAQLTISAIVIVDLTVATCVRHNAILATAPIFVWCAIEFARRKRVSIRRTIGTVTVFSLMTIGVAFAIEGLLDKYSLPELTPLTGSEFFVPSVQALDLAGASLCSKTNLFGEAAPGYSLNDIRRDYDPRHINLSTRVLDRVKLDNSISAAWQRGWESSPWCMLSNKIQLAKYLFGANRDAQFLITDPGISENRYGYSLAPSSTRDQFVSYTVTWSSLFFVRPWCLTLIATVLVGISVIQGLRRRDWFSQKMLPLCLTYASGFAYAAGVVALGNAADARLLFHNNVIMVMIIVSIPLMLRAERTPELVQQD